MKPQRAVWGLTSPALAIAALWLAPTPDPDALRQARSACGPRALAALLAHVRPTSDRGDVYRAFPDGGRIASFAGLQAVGRTFGLSLVGYEIDAAEFARRGGRGILHLDARPRSSYQAVAGVVTLGGAGAGGHFVAALGSAPGGGYWVIDPVAGQTDRQRVLGPDELARRWTGRTLVLERVDDGAR